MNILVTSSELEQLIYQMLRHQLDSVFPSQVSTVVHRMVEQYNHSQSSDLIDCVVEAVKEYLDDYSLVDLVVDHFVRLIEQCIDTVDCISTLEYDAANETIYITQRLKPNPPAVIRLKEEYQNAQSQGDFYPERLRRAFDELIHAGV